LFHFPLHLSSHLCIFLSLFSSFHYLGCHHSCSYNLQNCHLLLFLFFVFVATIHHFFLYLRGALFFYSRIRTINPIVCLFFVVFMLIIVVFATLVQHWKLWKNKLRQGGNREVGSTIDMN
jgi:hypothetical protein